ncbi:hypothetical protein HZS_3942 [Henneguya salminicola]|nr:hypothetical protein HZS_3942 [Henneguya salminicola]
MAASPDENEHIPTFITKLWEILKDSSCNKYICWSDNGKSVIIKDSQGFCKFVLPILYRHKNLSSFIRQLNMHGFHKKPDVSFKSLSGSGGSDCEFYHPDFIRNKPELLTRIKRRGVEEKRSKTEMGIICSDFSNIRKQNDAIQAQLDSLKMYLLNI